MKRILGLGVIAIALFSSACDGSDSGSGGGTDDWQSDPGGGNGALLVDAHIEGESWDATHLEVMVRKDGQPVSGAMVEIDSELGLVTLGEAEPGRYAGQQGGFAAAYKLRVTSGDDFLDATLEAPVPHEIDSPTAGASYDAAAGDLHVSWSPTGAQSTVVETDDAELELAGDPGEATIAASAFESDEDEVRVERANEIQLAGGAPESDFEVSYSDRNEFNVTNPAD